MKLFRYVDIIYIIYPIYLKLLKHILNAYLNVLFSEKNVLDIGCKYILSMQELYKYSKTSMNK